MLGNLLHPALLTDLVIGGDSLDFGVVERLVGDGESRISRTSTGPLRLSSSSSCISHILGPTRPLGLP